MMYSRKAVGFLRGIAIRIGRFFAGLFLCAGFLRTRKETGEILAAQAFFSAK